MSAMKKAPDGRDDTLRDDTLRVVDPRDGVHVRTYIRHDAVDKRWTMLTMDIYPLPYDVLPELIEFIGKQVNAHLVAQKVIADVEPERVPIAPRDPSTLQ